MNRSAELQFGSVFRPARQNRVEREFGAPTARFMVPMRAKSNPTQINRLRLRNCFKGPLCWSTKVTQNESAQDSPMV